MPKPTTTIFCLLGAALKPGLALPSTGSPCRSPSRTGMAGRRDNQTEEGEGIQDQGFDGDHEIIWGMDTVLREVQLKEILAIAHIDN